MPPTPKVFLVADEFLRRSSTPIEVALHYQGIQFDVVQPNLLDRTIMIRAETHSLPANLPHWLKLKHS